jgi:heptosyltransferase-2
MRRFALFLRNAYLVALCYGYFLVRGGARRVPSSPKKILVMPASKLGDMICATPVFRAIKKTYPGCKVVVLGTNAYASLHDGNPDVDEYLVWDEKQAFFKGVKAIAEECADAAIILPPGFLAAASFFMAGVPCVVGPRVEGGYSPYQTRPYRMLWPLILTEAHAFGSYAPGEYLKLLKPFGIRESDTKKHLVFSPEAEKKIHDFYAQNDVVPGKDSIVGISVSAGNDIKKWANKNFAEVAAAIAKEYHPKIVFIGSKGDIPDIQETLSFLNKGESVINAAGLFSVEELKALISKMKLFISVDTGPVYIAEAFGVATVDIVGPVAEGEQPPVGRIHKVVVLERAAAEVHIMNARVYNLKEARRQIESITVDMVMKEVRSLMQIL